MTVNKQITKLHNLLKKIGPSLIVLISLTSAILLSLAIATHVNAASIVVTTLIDEILDDGFCSLREAIVNSNDDAATYDDCNAGFGEDIIIFDEALGSGTIVLTSALPDVTSGSTLNIMGDERITISGNDLHNIFYHFCGTLEDLKISNMGGPVYYGILISDYSNSIIRNCEFSNNINEWSAIAVQGMDPTTLSIYDSTFSNNSSITGVIKVSWNGRLFMYESSMNNNFSENGGAIYNDDGYALLDHCSFQNNNVDVDGGSIWNNSEMDIFHSSFAGNNSSEWGGAIRNSGTLTVSNGTFLENTALMGGGICNVQQGDSVSRTNIYNSTFSQNSSSLGGGIYNSWKLVIKNSILANSINGGDCVSTTAINSRNNLIEDTDDNACSLSDSVNGNIIGLDPRLGALVGSPSFFPLLQNSPAIDAGDNETCANEPVNNTSQNGVNRPYGMTCDIGSYELAYPIVTSITTADPNPTSAESVNFNVSFNVPVTGVDSSDFELTTEGLTGSLINNISGVDDNYVITVSTGFGNGTIRLDVTDDDSVFDNYSEPLGSEGLGNGNFTDGEVYIINFIPYTIFMPLITNGN